MYRKFISPSEIKKLDIFKKISNSQGINIKTISNELNISIKTIQKYIKSLNEDLQTLNENVCLAKDSLNGYFLQIKTTEPAFSYTHLSYYYSKKSCMFNFIQLLLRNVSSITSICQELHISASHLYKVINQTNALLKDFSIGVKLTKKQFVTVVGQELHIRLFMFMFLNQCIPSDIWIFPTLSKVELVKKIEKLTGFETFDQPTKKKLLNTMQLLSIRYAKQSFLIKPDTQLEKRLKFYRFFSIREMEQLFPVFKKLNPEIIKTEYLYAGLFLQLFIPAMVANTYNQAIMKKLGTASWPLSCSFETLIDEWQRTYAPTINETVKKEILHQMLLVFEVTAILKIDLLKVWHFETITMNAKEQKRLAEIESMVKRHMMENFSEDLIGDSFTYAQLNFLSFFLYLEMKMHFVPTVTIFISNTIDYRTAQFIQAKIFTCFSASSIKFLTSDYADADLVITDRYPEAQLTKKMIILSNYLDSIEWNQLFTSIKDLLISKFL